MDRTDIGTWIREEGTHAELVSWPCESASIERSEHGRGEVLKKGCATHFE
jgi:hypothetical protein